MTKSLTIHIETDGKSICRVRNADIDAYNDIIKSLEKKKNIIFNNAYIMWQHVVKVWFEMEDEDD